MLIAALDTNVLASGFAGEYIPSSTPGELVRRWRRGEFALAISEHILTELSDTLAAPYFSRRLSPTEQAEALAALRRSALVVGLTFTVSGVATHAEDDLILATAVSAGVDYLVTGDRALRDRVPIYRASGLSVRPSSLPCC